MYGPASPFVIVQTLELAVGFIRPEQVDPNVFQVEARWSMKPGNRKKVAAALVDYVKAVKEKEPGTYMYTVSFADESPDSAAIPPMQLDAVTYNSAWKDHDAFVAHTKEPVYQEFLKKHGDLFVQTIPGSTMHPYMTTSVLKRFAGFLRPEAFRRMSGPQLPPVTHGMIAGSGSRSVPSSSGMTIEQLMLALIPLAQKSAIPPISNFFVGAVALGASGSIYFGANYEFVGQALSFTVHGEQAATAHAISLWRDWHAEARRFRRAVWLLPAISVRADHGFDTADPPAEYAPGSAHVVSSLTHSGRETWGLRQR